MRPPETAKEGRALPKGADDECFDPFDFFGDGFRFQSD